MLHLHFASTVTLTGVGTLFASAHETAPIGFGLDAMNNPFTHSNITGANSFLLSLTGIAGSFQTVTFGASNTVGGISFTGQDFYFEEGANQPQFYVSALSYNSVPGPVVGAGLPGLIAACGGLLALARRRRQLVA